MIKISKKPVSLTLKAIVMAVLAIIGMLQPVAAADVTNPAVVEAFVDGVVKPHMKNHNSPSGVVAVMKDGEMIFAKGYGFIDVEKRIPVDPKTSLFRPGSISKLFTWVSVMQLVEQGKLDLDTDVNTYLSSFKVKDTWPGQPVTMRHIMTHTAGFEDGVLGYLIIDDPSRIIPLAEAMARYQPERVNPPGKHAAYSNWATSLAGLIVANVSGTDFNTYVKNNIFDVLGMTSSTFEEPLPPELDANMAKAYDHGAGKYIETDYEIISNFGPAGAMATTAYDMALFAKALLNGGADGDNRILKPETLEEMLQDHASFDDRIRGVGLGFLLRDLGPDDFGNFGHDGGTTVFLSHFGLSLKEKFMIFSSFSGPGGGNVHNALEKGFYEQFFPEEISVITPPEDFSERADKYAGVYNGWRNSFTKVESIMRGLNGTSVVAMPDNTLLIGNKRFVEIDNNLFQQVDGTARAAFKEDENGQLNRLVFDGLGVMELYKAPFYETANFIIGVLILSGIIFVSVFIRLAYQWASFRALESQEKRITITSMVLAFCNIAFFALFALTLTLDMKALMYEVPVMLKVALIFPMLATPAALYHGYCNVEVWRGQLMKNILSRVRYSILSLCGLVMIWFYWYWNFLGFNYFN